MINKLANKETVALAMSILQLNQRLAAASK